VRVTSRLGGVAIGYALRMGTEPDPEFAQGASTLLAVLEAATQHGFESDLLIEPEPRDQPTVRCGACDVASPAAGFPRAWRWRLEGASDPDDMLDVSALRCPACGRGGTLVTAFGHRSGAPEAAATRDLPAPSGGPPLAVRHHTGDPST
jgi:hypothetical protein